LENKTLQPLSIVREPGQACDVCGYDFNHSDILEQAVRADKAKIHLDNDNPKQQEFLKFILSQYQNRELCLDI